MLVLRRLTHCPACGYAVDGLARRRCPECGRALEAVAPGRSVRERAAGLSWVLFALWLVSFQLAMVLSGTVTDESGSFDDLEGYVLAIMGNALIISLVLFIPSALVGAVLWLRADVPEHVIAKARKGFVYSVATLAPVAGSSLAFGLHQMARPGFFFTKQPVPAWRDSGFVAVLAHPAAMLVGCALMLVLAGWVLKRFGLADR